MPVFSPVPFDTFAVGSVWRLLGYSSAAFASYVVYKIARFFYAEWTSPLRILPGPPSSSWLYGNMKEIWNAENSVLHEKWVKEYGSTIRYKVFAGMTRLYTTDTKAINHILMNTAIYQKPEASRYGLSLILGEGVLVVEGEKHKQQRRIMNPAFGAAQIRELTDIFVQKSNELRDIWASPATVEADGSIDVLSWLSRMTLDVIGIAGFNYHFNALTSDPESNELNKAFSVVFSSNTRLSPIPFIRGMVPALRFLPAERDKESGASRATMNRIGRQLLNDSRASILAEHAHGKVEKSSWQRRDLLSLLLKANMATDVPQSQRMSDEDVVAQVPTFLVAGHETTSTATTWALFALTQAPEIQTKLRDELLSFPTDHPTMDDLNSLPYLDSVVRETLRLHAPVPGTMRAAMKDDILPLAKPVRGINGELLEFIQVKKGQTLMIPILAMNRDESIWGPDAREFNPERWQKIPEAATTLPGIWGNMLTFLGGPRACIGYRFSLVEMKALLFSLVRAFEFELAVPAEQIGKRSLVVQRPVVKTDPKGKNRMPLIIKPYKRV